jgi:hypothetical protein
MPELAPIASMRVQQANDLGEGKADQQEVRTFGTQGEIAEGHARERAKRRSQQQRDRQRQVKIGSTNRRGIGAHSKEGDASNIDFADQHHKAQARRQQRIDRYPFEHDDAVTVGAHRCESDGGRPQQGRRDDARPKR